VRKTKQNCKRVYEDEHISVNSAVTIQVSSYSHCHKIESNVDACCTLTAYKSLYHVHKCVLFTLIVRRSDTYYNDLCMFIIRRLGEENERKLLCQSLVSVRIPSVHLDSGRDYNL